MVSRRDILAGLVAAAAWPALAEVMPSSPRPVPRPEARPDRGATPASGGSAGDLAALVAAAKLGGEVAWALADARTGTLIDTRQPDLALPPASVAKAMTALYALDRLGREHRFLTRVLATGPVEAGIVQGDLVLAGGGDPTLQTDQLGDLVARLAQGGLRGVSGRFLVWSGALPDLAGIAPDQPPHVGYNAAISGLNLNFNRVHFEWKRAGADWQVAVDARGERFLPEVDMVRVAIAPREAPLFTYEPGLPEAWTVASAALGKGGSRWLPVRAPGSYVAEVFRTLARAQGIRLPPAEPVGAASGAELGRVESEPLPEVLRDMLRFSTNLTAECVGLTASGAGDLRASGRAMSDWLAQTFGVTMDLHDHSGLGGASRATAAGLAQVLTRAEAQGRGLSPILRDVGMKDDKGKVIEGHPVRVLAKSGTLNFVSGLAGYILPPSGRDLVFAILSGDPDRRDAVPVADREEPEGAQAWTRRARRLQGQLVSRWAAAHG